MLVQYLETWDWLKTAKSTWVMEMETILVGLSALFWIFTVIVFNFILEKAVDSIFYLNGLVSFVKSHPPKVLQSPPCSELLSLLLPCAMYICAVAGPTGCIYLFHWNDPCKASLVEFSLFPECRREEIMDSGINALVKICILAGNHAICLVGCQAAVYAIIIFQILGTLIFADCITIFWNE